MKSKIFKFEKGQRWDGDEAIIHYIEDVLLKENIGHSFPEVKQKTYITIQVAKQREELSK